MKTSILFSLLMLLSVSSWAQLEYIPFNENLAEGRSTSDFRFTNYGQRSYMLYRHLDMKTKKASYKCYKAYTRYIDKMEWKEITAPTLPALNYEYLDLQYHDDHGLFLCAKAGGWIKIWKYTEDSKQWKLMYEESRFIAKIEVEDFQVSYTKENIYLSFYNVKGKKVDLYYVDFRYDDDTFQGVYGFDEYSKGGRSIKAYSSGTALYFTVFDEKNRFKSARITFSTVKNEFDFWDNSKGFTKDAHSMYGASPCGSLGMSRVVSYGTIKRRDELTMATWSHLKRKWVELPYPPASFKVNWRSMKVIDKHCQLDKVSFVALGITTSNQLQMITFKDGAWGDVITIAEHTLSTFQVIEHDKKVFIYYQDLKDGMHLKGGYVDLRKN